MNRLCRGLLIALATCGHGGIPVLASEIGPPSSATPITASDDYVRIQAGRFELRGRPFVLRGINYSGSWRFPLTFPRGAGIEQATIWSLFHAWNPREAARDFEFLRSQLNATAIRIATPARGDFAPLVQYHGYEPWYDSDGSVTDHYKKILIELADTAYADGIRLQFCLLWTVGDEIAANPDDFAPGALMDRFYSNQVRSIAAALSDHPGVMAYSIGNEVLVRWPINGTHPSAFEGRAAGFMARRLRDVRMAAPSQLVSSDEGAHPGEPQWYAPGPEFASPHDPETGRDGPSFRLIDQIDYLGPHFYPETLKPEDLADDAFRSKLADAAQKLAAYVTAARASGKPVVINEFGLRVKPADLTRPAYSGPRDALYRTIIDEAERVGVQGLLPWMVLPELVLRPGDFAVVPSRIQPYSPFEVDIRSSGRRVLSYEPFWALFDWDAAGDTPTPTAAAKALAASWPQAR